MEDTELLKKRLTELAVRAERSGIFTFTDFLGLYEQAVFAEIKNSFPRVKFTAFGGTEGAERVIIRFGDPEELGYIEEFPIVCIKAEPKSEKFADRLTHRDFLGSLMNLGISRDVLGDIPIINNAGYIFAKEDMRDFLLASLERVKHTDVNLSVIDEIPEGELYKTEEKKIQVSSERLDAVIAKLYSLSRTDAQALFAKKLVFANGRIIESTSYTPKAGEKISVRGHGRFIYRGFNSLSKKGKLNITAEIYI